jgi:quercetin dioxygenase-like cupin family protein
MIGKRRFVAIAAASTALAFGAMQMAPAIATPGSGFVPGPIVTGQFNPFHTISHKDSRWPSWDLLFRTKADTDLGVDVLTVQPDGYSGWHSHAGPIYVTVKAGSVTWYDEACGARTFNVGDTYIEPAHSVHFVKNEGDVVATLVAVAPRPRGAPGRLDADEPECAKQE